MVIVFVLLAAVANSTASLCERGAARRADQNVSGLRFVRRVPAQPLYLAGVAAMTAGFLLQASALRDGAVSTVQTILTVELPLTVVLAAAVFHGSLSGRKSGAIAGMTIGLATLLLSADPTPGSEDPTAADWLLTVPVTAGALTMLVILGSRSRDRRRAALLGVASGGCFGLTAVLIKAAEIRLTEGWVVLLTSWPAYLLVATGATSVYLFGRAVQAGQTRHGPAGRDDRRPAHRYRAGRRPLRRPDPGRMVPRPGGRRGRGHRRVDPRVVAVRQRCRAGGSRLPRRPCR